MYFSQTDTSELEERHRQQLKDLEDAMRNTWEEKARVSAGYEDERRRLELEQKDSEMRLHQQIEEKWHVLEEKRDLDLSISHVKESAKTHYSEAVPTLASWQHQLRELLKLEVELNEQDTVVSVYKNSLLNDEKIAKRITTSEVVIISSLSFNVVNIYCRRIPISSYLSISIH